MKIAAILYPFQIQLNLSTMDTKGTEPSICIRGVRINRGRGCNVILKARVYFQMATTALLVIVALILTFVLHNANYIDRCYWSLYIENCSKIKKLLEQLINFGLLSQKSTAADRFPII